MTRKLFVLPALVLGGALFMDSSTASAQGFRPPVIPGQRIVQPNIRVAPHIVVAPYIVARPVQVPTYIAPPIVVPHCPTYTVFYRSSPFAPFQLYGVYRSAFAARDAVHDLRWLGYDAFARS